MFSTSGIFDRGYPPIRNFRWSTVEMFNKVPQTKSQGKQSMIFQKYQRIIKERILERADELMDALTDLVKDLPKESEIKKTGDLLKEVLEAKDDKDLAEKMSNVEKMLTIEEKNLVLKDQLNELKDTITKVMNQLVEINWSTVPEESSNKMYTLSQALSAMKSIIDALETQLSIDLNVDLTLGTASLIYLALRTNAYLMNKIDHLSLTRTISALQVFAYLNATYLVSN